MFGSAVYVPAAAAQTRAGESAPAVTGGLLQATLGLAIVLALIWGAAWIVRRIAPSTRTESSAIKVVATQNVGPRERVVLVEIAGTWLVVGVAPGRVSALHTLPKCPLPADDAPPTPFGRLLARAKGGPGA